MEKQPTIVAEHIHLTKIETLKEEIDFEALKNKEPEVSGFAHKMYHNLNDERVKIELEIVLKDSNKNDYHYCLMRLAYHFKIEKLNKFYQKNENDLPVFDGDFVATLLGISLSTARGILFEKLSRNGINNIILPVVSAQKLLKPDQESTE